MGRNLHWKPGSFYRVDDRTGFPQRAERTRKQWNGIIVDQTVWEPRQPQDLVKGVKDDQTVPDARPLAPNVFVGPLYLQSNAATNPGIGFVPLADVSGFSIGDEIGIVLDNGDVFVTGVSGFVPGGVLTYQPLPTSAASGNDVINYRIPFAAAFPVAGALLTTGGVPLGAAGGAFILLEG